MKTLGNAQKIEAAINTIREHFITTTLLGVFPLENNGYDTHCADCGEKANFVVVEENGSAWLYCRDCMLGD